MKLVKSLEGLKGPCMLYESEAGLTNDVVPSFKEDSISGSLLNHSINSNIAINPDYYDFSYIKDIRSLMYNSIHSRAKAVFEYKEYLHPMLEIMWSMGCSRYPVQTPDGIFFDMDDYSAWLKLYYKHPIQNAKELSNG